MPVVQRLGWKSRKAAGTPAGPRSAASAVGALAAATVATVAHTFTALPGPTHRPTAVRADDPPPPYVPSTVSASYAPPPGDPPPAYSAPLPQYTEVPAGAFDPRELTDFQLDELVHRIIGRITRLIRTELRLDRERIGKLRDPRR